MKKIIGILLATVLLMSCIALTAFAAGTQNPTITGANVEIPYGTTTAEVTFSVSEITYQDYGMWIRFDDGLSVSKVKVGPASQSPEDANSFRTFGYNKNTNLVATMGGDELTTSGVLFTVTFNVPANAKVGTSYNVSVEIDTVRNDANEYLSVDVVAGSIKVVCNDHKWDNGIVTKPACCHEPGVKTYTCTVDGCGETKTEPVPATGEHKWDNGVVTSNPSCYAPGVKTYTCTVDGCGETKTEPVPATGEHKWDNGTVTKPACCHEPGVKTYTCTVDGCGETKTEPVPATGEHKWDNGVVTSNPSCYAPGVKTYTCTVDGCGETKTEPVAATGDHKWDNGTVTSKPGHGVTGTMTYHCTNEGCTATKTEDIPAISEHEWDDGVVTKEPSCWDKGIKTFTCSICNGTKTEDIPATGNHVWDNGTVTKEPGCTDTGVKTYKCTNAGCTATKTEDIPATGVHVFDKETCEYGHDEHHHWLICECGEHGEKEDHIWKWIEDKKPTTTEFGSKHEECEICGYKRNLNTPVDKLEEGKDDVPQTGDITPYIVMSFVTLIALVVAVAYTLKRKFAK